MNVDRAVTGRPFLFLSDNDIVTEEHQNELLYWRDRFRIGQFDIGDIAAAEIDRMAKSGVAVTHDRVFAAIGRFCGKTARTVRYYYEQAIFYSPATRELYDTLPFSHFVIAHQYGNKWRDVLDYSSTNIGISEAALEHWANGRWQRRTLLEKIDVDMFDEQGVAGFIIEGVIKGVLPDKSCDVPQDTDGTKVQYYSSVEVVQSYLARTKHFLEQIGEIEMDDDDRINIRIHLRSAISKLENALQKMI